jgi:uncharacterized protein
MNDDPAIEMRGDVVRFEVQLVPRASRDAIAGVHDRAIKIAITAPPVDGEANAALIKLLSKMLRIPKKNLVIVRGESSRRKTIEAIGVSVDQVRALLR